jgi:hypothetical protein
VIDNITKYSVLDKQIELSRPTATGKIDFTLETEVIQLRTSTKKRQNMELFINIPCQVHFLVHRSTAPTDEHKSSEESNIETEGACNQGF